MFTIPVFGIYNFDGFIKPSTPFPVMVFRIGQFHRPAAYRANHFHRLFGSGPGFPGPVRISSVHDPQTGTDTSNIGREGKRFQLRIPC